ncbi:hypothetical protein NDU88_004292 [Pleurodeles waltl]|uniref:Uncharacterized protein n=1 Tax=Pleurodeles waltl TaxID=8319 RepID=A0AAV7V495_PLEWA|nr:hypothetical protein NDU88_004292 [Pleurodeles waltl]
MAPPSGTASGYPLQAKSPTDPGWRSRGNARDRQRYPGPRGIGEKGGEWAELKTTRVHQAGYHAPLQAETMQANACTRAEWGPSTSRSNTQAVVCQSRDGDHAPLQAETMKANACTRVELETKHVRA